jgi:phage shock protein A
MADEPTQQDDTVKAEPVAPAASANTVAPVPVPPVDTGYTPSGVPTFESVREKIETRYGTALGSAELDAETPEGRSAEEQYEARQRAAHDKLEEIRASMHQPDKP